MWTYIPIFMATVFLCACNGGDRTGTSAAIATNSKESSTARTQAVRQSSRLGEQELAVSAVISAAEVDRDESEVTDRGFSITFEDPNDDGFHIAFESPAARQVSTGKGNTDVENIVAARIKTLATSPSTAASLYKGGCSDAKLVSTFLDSWLDSRSTSGSSKLVELIDFLNRWFTDCE